MSKNKWGIELKPERICAIDASTNSLAYATFHDGQLKEFGKINFEGKDIYEKVVDAGRKSKGLFDWFGIKKNSFHIRCSRHTVCSRHDYQSSSFNSC
jgi:hypothetical protein